MKEISYMMEFFVYKSSPAFIDRICQTFFLPRTRRNAKIITSFIYLLIWRFSRKSQINAKRICKD